MKSTQPHHTPVFRTTSVFGIALLVTFLTGCGQREIEDQKVGSPADTRGDVVLVSNIPHHHEEEGETCFICDASKREKGRLWCKEHDRYEDRCWLCHPELEDKSRMWCKEHFLYEDECFLCHPELRSKDVESASTDGFRPTIGGLESEAPVVFCNEHGVPEAECGICQPQLAEFLQPGEDMKVRFVSTASAEKAGIQTQLPRMDEAAPVIEAFCETQYNLNTLARITPLVGGVIRRVFKDVGQTVEAGDALVELHSAEVAAAKSTYLSAVVELEINRQSYDREQRLQDQNVTSEKEFLEAQSTYRKSHLVVSNLRQRLINLGLETDEIARVEAEQDTSAQLIICAPFDGTLIERKSVIGEAVEAGNPLFTLADLSTRWLEISVPSDYAGQLQMGQPVEAVFPEFPNTRIFGNITWVDTSIDADTRMIRARALISQNAEKLASGMFGKIYIAIGNERMSATVPREAVQRHNGADFVFVQDAPDLFALRRVALGSARDGNMQVIAGLGARDSVVTDGSFIVMSEFLKSRLGAGCVDD